MSGSPAVTPRVRIIVPVYNDWASFAILLRNLDRVAAELPYRIKISAIDDGSTRNEIESSMLGGGLQHLAEVEIVRLAVNVGHQRAIAIGLCLAAEDADFEALVVMDSDGEDPPEKLPELLERVDRRLDFCIVASRRKRLESLKFKLSYLMYKTIFKLVTGARISFGNFCLLSPGYVSRLIMVPDLWNNLPAALLRSRLPIDKVSMDRGRRYAGKSHMSFTSLIVHGLSAISVYADAIFVRLVITTVVLVILTAATVTATLVLRVFFPDHATPGWATTVSFGMTIILLQVLFTALSSLLMLLNNRVQRLVLPAMDFRPYVRAREQVELRSPA